MKKNLSVLAAILIFIVTLTLAGLVIYKANLNFKDTDKEFSSGIIIFLCLGGLILSTFTVPLVHELGHLVFGLFNKLSFYSLKVAFLVIFREGNKIKLRIAKNSNAYSGACEMIPKTSDNLYKRFMMMVIGGSIFTLIYLAFLIYMFFNPLKFGLYAYSLIGSGLPVCFYLFMINIIPLNTGVGRTDGGVFLGLMKKDIFAMATINLLAIQSHLFIGKTPSEIDESLYFNVPQLPDDDVLFVMILNFRYIYYLDKNDIENALKVSERMHEVSRNLEPRMKHNIQSDILYNYCRFQKKSIEKCERLFNEVKKYLMLENTATNLRIRAAYSLYAEENYQQARQYVNRGLDEANHSVIKGIGRFETKLLEQMKAEIEKKQEKEEQKRKKDNLNYTRIFK